MPCIELKVNVKINEEEEKIIKSRLGEAIGILPGKSENWLMISIEDECRLYFKGDNQQGIAFVEVKIFGKASPSAYNQLTGAITDIIHQELNITPSNIYVKYEEVSYWGWNGNNF